ncbi:hypothetical protein [Pedobacter sp. V48]|uniref:hypothetical protein n=1 Tax=Pedobacter sp. V48 TaxID=509635 RepID=UPI0003E53BEC|nr:hypothetical protein [Pedobacter sp. V48]ETZ24507.1 hypothetical protein N824_13390 [Pedobacter sp. V48]
MQSQKSNIYMDLAGSDLDQSMQDALLYTINGVLYNFGDHHKSNNYSFKGNIKVLLRRLFLRFYCFRFFFKSKSNQRVIISSAYVDIESPGHCLVSPPWLMSLKKRSFSSWRLSNIVRRIQAELEKKSLRVIFSNIFFSLLKSYELEFRRLLKSENVACLIVPNDLALFENLSIKIAQSVNIPTIVYLHGLPGRYNSIDDNRADYLVVWGKGLKEEYINAGMPANKILTLKHPVYSSFEQYSLRSSFENVVVISKAMSGTPSSSDEVILSDRSKSLYYIERVKQLLVEMGVKSAKLRLHPSESESFYLKNIMDGFYSIDYDNKITTLAKASLVIGPTSTMALDAIKNGVNYILFDPIVDGKTLENTESLVKPFDGSSFIRLSKGSDDFKRNISNPNDNINITLLNEYMSVNDDDINTFLEIISR